MVPAGCAFLLAGMLTPLLVKRIAPGYVMAGGLTLAAGAFGTLVQVQETTPTAVVAAAFAVFSFGVTPVFALATDLIVGAAPRERAGVASGISETGAEFGGALGIAVFGSIGIAVYRGRLEEGVAAGVTPEQAEAARDTLGGANEVAAQLPDALGATLLDAARDAFTAGLQVTAITGAALLAVLAGLVAVLVRHEAPTDAGAELEPAAASVTTR
jgi:DHA2 family multidrug resistance protein-like MFS transporter